AETAQRLQGGDRSVYTGDRMAAHRKFLRGGLYRIAPPYGGGDGTSPAEPGRRKLLPLSRAGEDHSETLRQLTPSHRRPAEGGRLPRAEPRQSMLFIPLPARV